MKRSLLERVWTGPLKAPSRSVHTLLTGLFTTTTRCLPALYPLELAGLEIVSAIFELPEHPFTGHTVLQLAYRLFHPVVSNHDLQRTAENRLAQIPATPSPLRILVMLRVTQLLVIQIRVDGMISLFLIAVHKHVRRFLFWAHHTRARLHFFNKTRFPRGDALQRAHTSHARRNCTLLPHFIVGKKNRGACCRFFRLPDPLSDPRKSFFDIWSSAP